MNNNRLYVSNLPYSTTEADLEKGFGAYGSVVSAKVIFDKRTDRSRGIAFVEMASESEAQDVISSLNQNEFQGRKITVSVARPPVAREGGYQKDYGRKEGRYNRSDRAERY